jgi:hypothetical protein
MRQKRLLNNGKKEEMLFGDMDLPPDPRDNLETRSKNTDSDGNVRVVKKVYSFFARSVIV